MGEKIVLSCERADWQTPVEFLRVVREHRRIALDPCAAVSNEEWFARWNANGSVWGPSLRYAARIGELAAAGREPRIPNGCPDGQKMDWRAVARGGVVFMNPPYGGRKKAIDAWMEKAEREAKRGTEIIGLVPAATGAGWFGAVWRSAQAVCFVKGRMRFALPGGEKRTGATFWSAAPYWGQSVERFASVFGALGRVVVLRVPHAKRKRLAHKGTAQLLA